MPLTKKNEKENCASKTDSKREFDLAFANFNRESELLKSAHAQLQKQFDELKLSLKVSFHTLEQIISHLSDGLLFISNQGMITQCNQVAANLLETHQTSLLQKPYADCFDDLVFGFSMQKALKRDENDQRIILTLNKKKEVEVSMSCIPEHGILLLLHDRTERQQLEKSLSHANRLKELGEMAATLAHEIRNPLGGIEGFAQLLYRDIKRADHQTMLQHILKGTSSINHLITNVLDYSQPKQLHFTPTDLVSLIQEAIDLSHKACTFSSPSTQVISIDREKIKLVLLNLIRNAFESGATTVHIELNAQNSILIKDNGTGILQENMDKIFTPFFTTKTTGTGLGLAESLSVIEAHGGNIEVNSTPPKGTLFKIHLLGRDAH